MDKMSYRMFTWPNNPEVFQVKANRNPTYVTQEDGTVVFDGLAPLSRVITGSGVFMGSYAHESFNALSVIMASGSVGELVHPTWGKFQAYLTELKMEQESRPEYIVYSFTFLEANEDGMIPVLPEYVTQ